MGQPRLNPSPSAHQQETFPAVRPVAVTLGLIVEMILAGLALTATQPSPVFAASPVRCTNPIGILSVRAEGSPCLKKLSAATEHCGSGLANHITGTSATLAIPETPLSASVPLSAFQVQVAGVAGGALVMGAIGLVGRPGPPWMRPRRPGVPTARLWPRPQRSQRAERRRRRWPLLAERSGLDASSRVQGQNLDQLGKGAQ
jgi:hypothetical protein